MMNQRDRILNDLDPGKMRYMDKLIFKLMGVAALAAWIAWECCWSGQL